MKQTRQLREIAMESLFSHFPWPPGPVPAYWYDPLIAREAAHLVEHASHAARWALKRSDLSWTQAVAIEIRESGCSEAVPSLIAETLYRMSTTNGVPAELDALRALRGAM